MSGSASVSRVIGRRVGSGGVVRVGRLGLGLGLIVGVSWLSGRDGRGPGLCSRVERIGERPGLLRRITWLVVRGSSSNTSNTLLDGGETDWRLAVVFIITRPRQFILGSFTHTTNAAKATENEDEEKPQYNTDNSANAHLGV